MTSVFTDKCARVWAWDIIPVQQVMIEVQCDTVLISTVTRLTFYPKPGPYELKVQLFTTPNSYWGVQKGEWKWNNRDEDIYNVCVFQHLPSIQCGIVHPFHNALVLCVRQTNPHRQMNPLLDKWIKEPLCVNANTFIHRRSHKLIPHIIHPYKQTCFSSLLIMTKYPPWSWQNCLLSDQLSCSKGVKNPSKAHMLSNRNTHKTSKMES